jgi:hypothetical protein
MRITLYALAISVAFYALLVDMCIHLEGWRWIEPFAFFAVIVIMAALGRVIFSKDSREAA